MHRTFFDAPPNSRDVSMAWTQDDDTRLTELHSKRLGVRFISVWLRQPAASVRSRLIELGLEKPLSAKASHTVARAKKQIDALAAAPQPEIEDCDDEDDGDLRASRGCPRGHLISEAQIAALYHRAGCDYR
jgi:hypothetical protein